MVKLHDIETQRVVLVAILPNKLKTIGGFAYNSNFAMVQGTFVFRIFGQNEAINDIIVNCDFTPYTPISKPISTKWIPFRLFNGPRHQIEVSKLKNTTSFEQNGSCLYNIHSRIWSIY